VPLPVYFSRSNLDPAMDENAMNLASPVQLYEGLNDLDPHVKHLIFVKGIEWLKKRVIRRMWLAPRARI
jgi:hypothetical protein